MTPLLTPEVLPTARPLRAAVASRRGVRAANMDAGAVFKGASGITAAAVIDGIGNDVDGAAVIGLLAQTAVRIGVTRGALAGIVAAAALIEDAGTSSYRPDAVAVLAVAEPSRPTQLAWAGDAHAYSWNGQDLVRRTDPHTMGAFLRHNGDVDLAPRHDNWVRLSLASSTVTTVALSEIPPGELVLLASDGLDGIGHEQLAALVEQHQHDPQTLARAIVVAAPARPRRIPR